jgi:RHS repeat-associated protein
VTNRYTGQPIDEETGLYFYQSRYYDAELGRFTQADTIVPSSNTSQALNRYAYVKNNPLKFTDPSGHGWLSKAWKKIKGYIGTILTVALSFTPLAPFAAIIGSAVGALINGGTWKSFAIGAAIGMAAGVIADAIGGLPVMCGVEHAIGSTAMNFVSSAITGAVSGAISSAVYGGNWGNNIGQGAMGGAIGAGVAGITGAVTGKLKAWVQGMSATAQVTASVSDPNTLSGDPNTVRGPINLRVVKGKSIKVSLYDTNDTLGYAFQEAADDYDFSLPVSSPDDAASSLEFASGLLRQDETITDVYIFDHGNSRTQIIGRIGLTAHSKAWSRMTSAAPHATFHLRGCSVGGGGQSYIAALSQSGNVFVDGFDDLVYYYGTEKIGADYYSYGNLWRATPNGNSSVMSEGGAFKDWFRGGRR